MENITPKSLPVIKEELLKMLHIINSIETKSPVLQTACPADRVPLPSKIVQLR